MMAITSDRVMMVSSGTHTGQGFIFDTYPDLFTAVVQICDNGAIADGIHGSDAPLAMLHALKLSIASIEEQIASQKQAEPGDKSEQKH